MIRRISSGFVIPVVGKWLVHEIIHDVVRLLLVETRTLELYKVRSMVLSVSELSIENL